MAMENFYEEFKVQGRELVEKVRHLIHEGNVQRVMIKDDHGHTFVEIPVTVAAVGVIVAPVLAAVGALAALAARFTIVVERTPHDGTPPPAA
jgi:D-mannonate dehydratase